MTNYIENINNISMESNAFDGQFISISEGYGVDVCRDISFSADQWRTFSLEDIVPYDGYDYEVQFTCFAKTGTTSGNSIECHLISGTSNNAYPGDRQWADVCRGVTRASSTQNPAGNCILVIKSHDRKISVNNTDSDKGTITIIITGIRRLGNNLKFLSTNYISNIGSLDNTIGGQLLSGQWVSSLTVLVSGLSLGTLTSSGYSLANILPNDGRTYELLCNAQGRTGTTSGNSITLRVGTSSTPHANIPVGRQVTRTANYMETGGQVRVFAKSTDKLYVSNSGENGTSTEIKLVLSAYRRVGTNESKNLKNIGIKSNTLLPNTVIYGAPTIKDNTVRNFKDGCLVVPDMKHTTATYIICFTTPSSTSSSRQTIAVLEHIWSLDIEETGFKVSTWIWGDDNSYHQIFTANANTKYWVKFEINGTSKIVSYSTDGINYTQSLNSTDPSMDFTSDFDLWFGNHSANQTRYFNGAIHLDECLIIVNNEIIWRGMNYKRFFPIGGYIADNQWVESSRTIYEGSNISSGRHLYTIRNYLPENNVQYEILCHSRNNTGATSGNANKLWIEINNQVYGNPILSRIITRVSSNVNDAKSVSIICIQKNGEIPIEVQQDSDSTTGKCALTLLAYRRIGDNI